MVNMVKMVKMVDMVKMVKMFFLDVVRYYDKHTFSFMVI